MNFFICRSLICFLTSILLHTVSMEIIKNQESPFIFCGYDEMDEKALRSSISHAFQVYRHALSHHMNVFTAIIENMNRIDRNYGNREVVAIHKQYQNLAQEFPHFIERNEDYLHGMFRNYPIHLENYTSMNTVDQDSKDNDDIDTSSSSYLECIVSEPENIMTEQISQKNPNYYYRTPNQMMSSSSSSPSSSSPSYDSVEQLLSHLNRDWGMDGKDVRKKVYIDLCVKILVEYYGEQSQKKILIPGAGLGRLAIEIATRGFLVEANEFSGLMTATTYSILNDIIHRIYHKNQSNNTAESIDFDHIIFPYLHYPLLNNWKFENHFKGVAIPYFDDMEPIIKWLQSYSQENKLSIHDLSENDNQTKKQKPLLWRYGDFMKIYSNKRILMKDKYDCIVTSFFIDTLPITFIETLEIFTNILLPSTESDQGLWINIGPLQYHSNTSIPYSYSEIISIAKSYGFEILSEQIIDGTYCGEEQYMMKPEYYRIPFTIFKYIGITEINSKVDDNSFERSTYYTATTGWKMVDFIMIHKKS